MEKILAKLPELQRHAVQNTLDVINNESIKETRDLFVMRLHGQADILFAGQLISADEYIFMVHVK